MSNLMYSLFPRIKIFSIVCGTFLLRFPTVFYYCSLVQTEKSYQINLKSDCIYQFPIDFEQQTDVRLVPNQSVHGKYNLISV